MLVLENDMCVKVFFLLNLGTRRNQHEFGGKGGSIQSNKLQFVMFKMRLRMYKCFGYF